MSELAIQRVINEMDPNRVTDKDGRWFLRHATLGENRDDDDLHVFLTSAHAPTGTLGCDLVPASLEFSGLPEGDMLLPLVVIAELSAWPAEL